MFSVYPSWEFSVYMSLFRCVLTYFFFCRRLRVYCAKSSCGTFLHPSVHVKDEKAAVTYAVCEGEGCGEMTCVSCKTVIEQGTNLWNHVCEADEEERKFKQMAKEEGFQECFSCGRMVELTEACNHIT